MNEGRYYIYDFEDEGTLYVSPRCPKCGRYLKAGVARLNKLGTDTRFEEFTCKRCGEVEPENYFYD